MLTRRSLLQLSGVAGLSLGAGLLPRAAHADPDTPGAALPPDPEIFPFRIGTFEAFAILDGVFVAPSVQPLIAPEGKPAEVNRLLQDNYLPTDHVALGINVLVLRQNKAVTLVDTGSGAAMGPSAGRLLRGLAKIGVTTDQVTNIVITHAHGDHIAGLLNADGQPTYPNAKVYINKTEADFWLGTNPDLSQQSRVTAADKSQAIGTAKKFLTGVGAQLQRVGAGTILPGIELIDTPGHTHGHAAILITSGSDKLLHVGDAVHSAALQFPHPEWTLTFDSIPSLAIASRRRIFARAVAERLPVMAYHLSFPGVGHVRASGHVYEWVPRPWVS